MYVYIYIYIYIYIYVLTSHSKLIIARKDNFRRTIYLVEQKIHLNF